MTALEEIKKPLEGRDIATLTNVELVTEISRILSTLESLQRENEELRADVKREAELATHMANDCNDAQAEVKRMREALQNVMGCYDTPLSRRRFPPDGFMTEAINTARTALASTGGEHNAE